MTVPANSYAVQTITNNALKYSGIAKTVSVNTTKDIVVLTGHETSAGSGSVRVTAFNRHTAAQTVDLGIAIFYV